AVGGGYVGGLDLARLPQRVGDDRTEGTGVLVGDAHRGRARRTTQQVAEEAEDDDGGDKQQRQSAAVAAKALQEPARDGADAVAAHDSLRPASARNASSRFGDPPC